MNSTKLKTAIPSGWDAKQFEYNYKEIVPPRLQTISSKNEWYKSSDLMQKSEMYSLPQTALRKMLKLLMPSSLMMFEEVNTFQIFELNLHYQTTHF